MFSDTLVTLGTTVFSKCSQIVIISFIPTSFCVQVVNAFPHKHFGCIAVGFSSLTSLIFVVAQCLFVMLIKCLKCLKQMFTRPGIFGAQMASWVLLRPAIWIPVITYPAPPRYLDQEIYNG